MAIAISERRKRQIVDGLRMGRNSGNCEICGLYRRARHRDRKVPKRLGGTYAPSNVQYICANCHQDKSLDEEPISIPEERRRRISASLKKRFKTDPSYKKKISAGLKKRYLEDPDFRKRVSEGTKQGLTPEVCAKRAKSLRKYHRRRRANAAH